MQRLALSCSWLRLVTGAVPGVQAEATPEEAKDTAEELEPKPAEAAASAEPASPSADANGDTEMKSSEAEAFIPIDKEPTPEVKAAEVGRLEMQSLP